jgi:hypothetical protein
MTDIKEQIEKILVSEQLDFYPTREKSPDEDIQQVLDDAIAVQIISSTLFDKSGKIYANLFERLNRLEFIYGYSKKVHQLIGNILGYAFEKISEEEKNQQLNSLVSSNNDIFWTMIHAFQYFLPSLKINAKPLSEILLSISKRVEGDLAGGELYKAIEEYCCQHPSNGIYLLQEILKEPFSEAKLHISSILLGTLRVSRNINEEYKALFNVMENQLKTSLSVEYRKCYYRSFCTSFLKGATSIEQIRNELNAMLKGALAEQTEAFNIAARCTFTVPEQSEYISFYFSWLHENSNTNIQEEAKYYVVDSLWRICSPQETTPTSLNITTANNILLNIQPIPESAKGIWRQMEYYLVDRLKEDASQFFILFVELCKRNKHIIDLLGLHNHFEYLMTSINQAKAEKHIAELLISQDRVSRTIGIRLFHEIELDESFDITTLPKPNEGTLELFLWEIIKTPLLGNPTSKLLILIEPLFRDVNQQLRDDFQNELVFQAINYPKACLERWKSLKSESPLIKSAISIADKYFSDLKGVFRSSANSFGFAGLADSVKYGARKYSQKIDSSVKERSIFRMFAKNIQVIYGNEWATYINGTVNPPTRFQEVSHSIEGPRIDEIDPEGMAIRRIQAASAINHKKQSDDQPES